MSDRSLRNRVDKLKALETQKKAIEKQMESLQEEIKAEMKVRGTDETTVGDWLVRFKSIAANRFQTSGFKADHPKLYQKYMAQSPSERFTITTI